MASSTRTVVVNIVGEGSGLNKTLSQAGDKAASTGTRIGGAFKGAFGVIANSSNGAFGPLQQIMSGMGPAFDGLSDKGAKLGEKMVGVGAGVAGAGMALSAFGSSDQAAEQQLAQAIQNTGGSFDEYKGKIDATVKSGEKYGYTANLTMGALQTLTTATGSAGKATADFGVVANLAAARHMDLNSAATAYARILGGTGSKTLVQFGITQADVTAKMKESNGTMTKGQAAAALLLAAAVKGQASAASDTFKGKLDHLKASLEDNVAAMGKKFGPAMTMIGVGVSTTGSLITAGSAIMEHFSKDTKAAGEATDTLKGSQEALAGSEGIAAVADDAEAASTGIEDAALGTEDAALGITEGLEMGVLAPILLIVAAAALLGFGIYELATHWKKVWAGIKDVTVEVWHGIDNDFIRPVEGFFTAIPNFVRSHWELLLAILTGPIGLAVLFIKDHFDDIKHFFEQFPSDMASIGAHMFDWIGNAFKSALDALIGLWNGLHFTVPSIHIPFVGTVGGETIRVPQIPMLAAGGIVTSPMLAILGEAGPEAIIPLGSGGAGGMGGGGHDHAIIINLDGRRVGAGVAQHVRQLLRTTGRDAPRVGLG